MQTTFPIIQILTPGPADVLAAGRDYPARDALAPLDHATASAHLRAIHGWWLDVAEGYCDLAANAVKAEDFSAAEEIIRDAQEAFAQASRYAPQAAS